MTAPIVIQQGGSPIVQQSNPTPVVVRRDGGAAVVVTQPTNTVVVAVAQQGPRGPQGAPGSGSVHLQLSAELTWTINHNLGIRPGVDITDTGGMAVNADVLHTSVNQTVVSFVVPTAGIARLS